MLFPAGIIPIKRRVVGSGYQIARSLRFNSADSAYLNRTFGTPTDNKKYTYSLWVKRGALGANLGLLGGDSDGYLRFNTSDKLELYDYPLANSSGSFSIITTRVFRDPTAWLHIVLAVDTANGTSNQRLKLFINGVQETAFDTFTTPNSGVASYFNKSATTQRIGAYTGPAGYFSGYMADVLLIDGQALTPTDFGEFNATTGVWVPKTYAGTYGTNGFWLDFSDNSNTTAATLGADRSGNGNNWTPNNFYVSAGVGNDSLTDTPTNYGTDTGAGGEVRGNYATWNPLDSGGLALTNGNLNAQGTGGSHKAVRATIPIPSTGKWRIEVTLNALNANCVLGVLKKNGSLASYIGGTADGWGWNCSVGSVDNNGGSLVTGLTTATTNDVAEVLFDNGSLYVALNGTILNSGSPVATGLTGELYFAMSQYTAFSWDANFGQRPFSTTRADYKALCTQNLTDTTVAAPASFTGNAAADGPYIWANGVIETITINGNVATEGTHFRKVAGGAKIITSSSSYNNAGSNTVTAATYGDAFKYARAQ